MIQSLVFSEIYLSAVRALPKEERTILHLVFKFRILRNVDASVYNHFVLLAAFAARSQCFVDN
jgi:hypothetical protein